jgi:hypothetical protein
MARPEADELDVTKAGWVATLNSNFELVLDAPFPIYLAADKATLDAITPGLYVNCFALVATDSRLYISDGTSWNLYDAKLDFMANLNTGTATLNDIKTAYNDLIADMKAKGMMATS